MNLKLLLLCLFLAALLVTAEPVVRKPKEPPHHRHQPERPSPGVPKHSKWAKFKDLINDFFFEIVRRRDDDDEEDDEPNTLEWLLNLLGQESECDPNPCFNDGVCKQKGRRKFKCDCPRHFKGKRCEKGPKRCKRGLCGRGECVLTSAPPFYECKCKEPFQPPRCTTYSVCQPNPCRNGGTCVRDGNDYACQCPPGFRGHFCHVGPEDCYVDNGESYRGNVSQTEEGDECLYWNSHFILNKGVDPFDTFDDKQGLGPHNFCRNPDRERKPWCFVRRGLNLLWAYCDVASCDDSTDDTSTEIESPSSVTIKPSTTGRPSRTQRPAPTAAVGTPAATVAPQQFSSCGRAQPRRPITRIYAGLKVAPGAIPWQVSLQVRPRNSNRAYMHICGGVLIDSCWVLTAAHCIELGKDMQVVMGSLSMHTEEPTEQIIEVQEAIKHENFRETPTSVHNDIALLRLKGTDGVCAHETQFVRAACIPDVQLADGTECTISGWGVTEQFNMGSNHLLEANVLLINQQKCSESAVYGNVLDNTMFCAGHLQGGVDSCQGDSGGPLTCKQSGISVLYGLVSWGDQCGKKNKPGVYTRVTNFLDWIRAKTQAAPP